MRAGILEGRFCSAALTQRRPYVAARRCMLRRSTTQSAGRSATLQIRAIKFIRSMDFAAPFGQPRAAGGSRPTCSAWTELRCRLARLGDAFNDEEVISKEFRMSLIMHMFSGVWERNDQLRGFEKESRPISSLFDVLKNSKTAGKHNLS